MILINGKEIQWDKSTTNELLIKKELTDDAILLRSKNVKVDFTYMGSESLIALILIVNYIKTKIHETKNIIIDVRYLPYNNNSYKKEYIYSLEFISSIIYSLSDLRTTIILNEYNFDSIMIMAKHHLDFSSKQHKLLLESNSIIQKMVDSIVTNYITCHKSNINIVYDSTIFKTTSRYPIVDGYKNIILECKNNKYLVNNNEEMKFNDDDIILFIDHTEIDSQKIISICNDLKKINAKNINIISLRYRYNIIGDDLLKENILINSIFTTNIFIDKLYNSNLIILDFNILKQKSK